MTEAKWFVARGGVAAGPYPVAELARMAATGALARTDRVHLEGGTEWVAAATVPGVFTGPPIVPAVRARKSGLVPCAKCGADASDTALACPRCGERQPAAEAQEPGKRGAKCGTCGTFNLVSGGFGRFEDAKCRGCGYPLRDTNPDEFLDAEMERVYEYSVTRPPGAAPVWALLITGVLACRDWFPTTDKGTTSPVAFCVTLGLVYLALRAAGARYARWAGTCSEYGARSEVAGRMRGRSWDAVAAKYARSRAPAAPARPGPPWGLVAGGVAVALALGAAALYRAEFTQYELGRKAGVAHVREMSARGGAWIRSGMTLSNALDLIPSNPDATPDWNAGFRTGFKEELARMYPRLKGP